MLGVRAKADRDHERPGAMARRRTMSSSESSPTVWVVDPISYSGLAYTDVGQIIALQELGAHPLLVGSDSWMLEPEIVPRIAVFRGTHGTRSRFRKGVGYVVSLVRLLARIRSSRPHVVHWQFTELPVADVLAMLAIRFLGIPQVYTAHELLPWTAGPHHRWLFSRLYSLVDAVVVHNEDQRNEIIRRFSVGSSKVHVAPLGDYALFATPHLPQSQARARLGLSADPPVALFFGTIRPSKGLEILLEAWALVAPKMPEAILLVVGKPFKGLDTKKTIALIERFGIENSVRTRFEQVNPVDTNTYYRAADVVVLPYHAIGSSGVLRYAYNSARPVIATSVGEHGARVVAGQTGHLVPPGNPHALAKVLIDSLGDRATLRSMGEAAHVYAATNFKWLDPARRMLRIYEDLRRRV
jgi:glycosyltransferase involved in cell wall biosynthesis